MNGIIDIKRTAKEALELLANPRFIGPVLAGTFCLTVATVIGITYLFSMATVLLCMPAASYIVGILAIRKITCSHTKLLKATQGASFFLEIRSDKSNPLPEGAFVKVSAPPVFSQIDKNGTPVDSENNCRLLVEIEALKRGRFRIGPIDLIAQDPLGMFKLRKRIGDYSEIIVYPKPIRVSISPMTRRSFTSEESGQSLRRTARGDFAGVREYRTGDEYKRIHWKTTARTGSPKVIEYEGTGMNSAVVALDTSKGTDFGEGLITSLDAAAGAAAYMLDRLLSSGMRVRLVMQSENGVKEMELAGRQSVAAGMEALADAKASSSLSAAEMIMQYATEGGIVLITSRPDDKLKAAVRRAAASGTAVHIVLIDPRQFGVEFDTGKAAAEFNRVGAEVELIQWQKTSLADRSTA